MPLADAEATAALGRALADALPEKLAGWSILLSGDLGAGKSTLARAVIQQLGHDGPVPSPTYTLVEPYELPPNSIYHVDLYRINDAEELRYLGFGDLADGLMLVEWPEHAVGLTERSDVLIELAHSDQGRTAALRALSDRAADLVRGLTLGGH
jgi:tRNA threonylcarbamoyladenosine biosynthesis protein TsaE